jgi:RsiW-degrading membrane proteinase PrsW (M82 family)
MAMDDRVDHEPGVEHEPVFRHDADTVEKRILASDELGEEPTRASYVPPEEPDPSDALGDEPALRGMAAGGTLQRYFDIYEQKRREASSVQRLMAVLLALALSGPFAVAGAFVSQGLGGGQSLGAVIAICAIAPLIEEMLKITGVLYLAERKPWLIPHGLAIPLIAVASGLAFGVIENVIYLNIYIPDADPEIRRWRWTVCTSLHGGCSLIAGLGVLRMYRSIDRRTGPPMVSLASPYLIAATVLHGVYNLGAVFFSSSQFLF